MLNQTSSCCWNPNKILTVFLFAKIMWIIFRQEDSLFIISCHWVSVGDGSQAKIRKQPGWLKSGEQITLADNCRWARTQEAHWPFKQQWLDGYLFSPWPPFPHRKSVKVWVRHRLLSETLERHQTATAVLKSGEPECETNQHLMTQTCTSGRCLFAWLDQGACLK